MTSKSPDRPRVLIVFDNDSDTERLEAAFREVGLTSERTNSMAGGCELARSGDFQVIFSSPRLSDGPWMRLIDVANNDGLSFEVILLARTFDFNQWAEALQVGAFDVLDVLCDLPKAAEAAMRAFGTAYPKRFRPRPDQVEANRAGTPGSPHLEDPNGF